MKIVIPGNINIDTGVVTPSKELELVLTPPPDVPEGYRLVEWTEETETQYIQQWSLVPDEAAPADYEAALGRLGVET